LKQQIHALHLIAVTSSTVIGICHISRNFGRGNTLSGWYYLKKSVKVTKNDNI